jgi:uncharacterized protein GlcG (DUF336 family)
VAALLVLACVIAPACGGGGSVTPPPPPTQPAFQPLTSAEVSAMAMRAAGVANVPMVIAVVDRSGNILAVFRKTNAPATAVGNFGMTVDANELAVSLARTGAFFSHNQAPLSSRTVRFISGIHFPPGVDPSGTSALYGIENTNRGCTLSTNYIPGKAVPPSRNIAGTGPGLGITTGKANLMDDQPNAVNPGGVPIYRGPTMMGGIGVVAGASGDLYDVAEFAAAVGAGGLPPGIGGFTAIPNPPPTSIENLVVFVDGIALPFVNNLSLPPGFSPDSAPAGSFVVAPTNSPGPTPDGDLVAPTNGPVGGLTAAEVRQIIDRSVEVANATRAVIRLPIGARAKFVIAVADLDGTIIGMHRQPDATVFSIDVAASKARNMIYFNLPAASADLPGLPTGTAITNRTISFGAQPLFPPGIGGTQLGPFFNLYVQDTLNPCTQGSQPAGPNQSGIVFFPGSMGLYRNGVLVGGLGISGDGVEQDDFVTACAVDPTSPIQCPTSTLSFEPAIDSRADRVEIMTPTGPVRMPFFKFPRNPTD